ncbi:MAG: ABC-ATPase domain-containing protein [Acetatifactor sp.]|nr:ABC-ATPase domain-containing protein [Acetatifactor sp.]
MKRLKYILLHMDQMTSTYRDMYEGPIVFTFPDRVSEEGDDNVFYHGSVGFAFSVTNRKELDKPTVVIQIPCSLLKLNRISTAVLDFCLREFTVYIDEMNAELENGKHLDRENGRYYCYKPGSEIVTNNGVYAAYCRECDYEHIGGVAVRINSNERDTAFIQCICFRLQVQLPYKKMKKAIRMLCEDLPYAVNLFIANFNQEKLTKALELENKQNAIRNWLSDSEYCAFIANGSILPRTKRGDQPKLDAALFVSPKEDEIEICGVKGMGIRKGVSVITGGGYSGKTTILNALQSGIYNHVLGDGRELCITDESAVEIVAEDGRPIYECNISTFFRWVSDGEPERFSAERASGSTSQAANIIEAIDGGARLLLIDEDRSATNFMIRDKLMRELVSDDPIVPFVDRVHRLYTEKGVSSILIIGGCSDFLKVADYVYIMKDYTLINITMQVLKDERFQCGACNDDALQCEQKKSLSFFNSVDSGHADRNEKLVISKMGYILIGDMQIDLRCVHSICSYDQLIGMGMILKKLSSTKEKDLLQQIDELYREVSRDGLDCVYSSRYDGVGRFAALPRKMDIYAAIRRMRETND